MAGKLLAVGFLLGFIPLFSAQSCPSVCTCKWKNGKQTVECLERALITIPEQIDPETQVLNMSGNNLQILPRETFLRVNLLNLQKVYLKSCRIGQIDDHAFRGLTNLVELDLSHNLLTSVPSTTFKEIRFLRYISLANNPIQKVEANAFRTVPTMGKIDLSNCEIKSIAPNAFEKLDMLELLKLNGNRLTGLLPRTVETMSKLHGVELHDNPWLCDCRLRSTKEWLSNNNIPYPIAPRCHGPPKVASKTFAELDVDDFACRPEILPVSRYVEATTGENATVVCRVGAVPVATVHWYWNGRLLLNNTAFSAYQRVYIFEDGKFEKTSSLVLTNALETDSSEFYCVAENRAGSAEANFTLHVALRTAGMASLGSGQIAGLSAALVILILAILMVALVLLVRLRRLPFSESKTPGQLEVIATMNGSAVTTTTKPVVSAPRMVTTEDSTNPVAKPPRAGYEASSPSQTANPDIIPDSGDYPDGLYPTGLWPQNCQEGFMSRGSQFDSSDKTPIICEEDDDFRSFPRLPQTDYPPDYGLPILDQYSDGVPHVPPSPANPPVPMHPALPPQPNAKTVRVWQKGVPVLPPGPATALKRVLTNSRNSPDEGYQEGCGTDV